MHPSVIIMKIVSPKTKKEFEKYYDLRWRILRKPWNQSIGSEKDEIENTTIHLMVIEGSKIIGVGRGQFNTRKEAQIRYMAVEENQQGKGIGSKLLNSLENRLKKKGVPTGHLKKSLKFAKNKGFKRCDAEIAVENIASLKLIKKLGFRIEGRKKKGLLMDDRRYVDTYVVGKVL